MQVNPNSVFMAEDFTNELSSAYTFGAKYAVKQGNVITIEFVVVDVNNIPNGATVLTIPSELRPTSNYMGGVGVAAENIGDGNVGALFTVQPNGNIVANYEKSMTASVVRGIIVYSL